MPNRRTFCGEVQAKLADVLCATEALDARPVADQAEDRPVAGQAEDRPVAGQAEDRPVAGQAEDRPVAGQAESRPVCDAVAVLVLGLDDFKSFNATFGHDIGSDVLQQVAARVRGLPERGWSVGRVEGDVFAVAARLTAGQADRVAAIVARLSSVLIAPILSVGGVSLSLTGSVGVSMTGTVGGSMTGSVGGSMTGTVGGSMTGTVGASRSSAAFTLAEKMLRDAEIAMYRAKAHGQGWAAYNPALDERTSQRLLLAAELRAAIAANQIAVHYQPVVDMHTGRVTSVEALARWTHPTRGPISPAEFIPLAESRAMIADLTANVVSQVAAQTRQWARRGRVLPCAINLSVRCLIDTHSTERLVKDLSALAGSVTVEVTESVMANVTAIAALQRLAAAGVPCAIDDFGTGFSSLAALKNLPVTTLKIDRMLVKDIERDERDFAMVRAIVEMADALGLDVIAEGMETEATALRVRDAGVVHAQGFYYATPMTPAQLAIWLDSPFETPKPCGSASGSGQIRQRSGLARPGPSLRCETEPDARLRTAQILLDSTRSLLRVDSAEQAVGVLLRAILDLGGATVPAIQAPTDAIPIDVSLGEADPLLPIAPLGSPARGRLEQFLPGLVEDARTAAERVVRLSQLSEQVDTDPLTGLGNRRALTRVGQLREADSIAVVDLDNFKGVNDAHGHDEGDRVLVAFSRALRQHLRVGDLVFRLGGEEFLVILPGTTPRGALVALGHLREKWCWERPRPVNFSAGVAGVYDGDLRAALRCADAALYSAKVGGRDRFEAAGVDLVCREAVST